MSTVMEPYTPSRRLDARIRRKFAPLMGRRVARLDLERSVVSFTFDDAPASVARNALPQLEARGWPATLYIATGLLGTINHHGRMMTGSELRENHYKGHEIAAHGHAHVDYATLSDTEVVADAERAEAAFESLGLPAPAHFAWPYGETSAAAKRVLQDRYGTLRGTQHVIHRDRVDLNQVGSWRLFSSHIDLVMEALDDLKRMPGWITLFGHDVRDTPSAWGCTPREFERVVERVARAGFDVRAVGDVASELIR